VKPAAFAYHDPRSVDEALSLLTELGSESKLLAGGQSLVPAMNFRLARPAHLIDLNRVPELSYLRVDPDGWLVLGAMTRQRTVERSADVGAGWPLIVEALRHVGHQAIRSRGTIGGSLAHADPAAELPAVMTALDAQLVVRSSGGSRTVPASEFFVDYLTTCLGPDELLSEIRVPPLPAGARCAFQEVSRRWGDFALVGVAAVVTSSSARLAFTGVGPTPVRVDLPPGDPAALGQQAAANLRPDSDLHASAQYRQEVAAVLAERALRSA
jgi:aerobic carbon-monoxide dehydrogenase medium subunit